MYLLLFYVPWSNLNPKGNPLELPMRILPAWGIIIPQICLYPEICLLQLMYNLQAFIRRVNSLEWYRNHNHLDGCNSGRQYKPFVIPMNHHHHSYLHTRHISHIYHAHKSWFTWICKIMIQSPITQEVKRSDAFILDYKTLSFSNHS